ncbi:MAG: TIGR03663 family protein, partial [Anaerolineae bacterium]|nr:TIGR03663 family protein [Anaerolineae bacterium]
MVQSNIPQSEPTQSNGLSNWLSGRLTLNWEVVVLVVILVLAIFTRFYVLGDRVMSHDESLHTRFSYNLYNEGNFEHTPLMHGPILFHATALSYALFGVNDFSARIYAAALGVLLVMSPVLFRPWLGRWGTIIASGLLLISPLIMYYNRYIRHDTPSALFAVIMLWGIMMYLSGPANQRRRAHWLYIIAAAMILNLGSKETAFIYIAIFGIFIFLYWLVRLAQHYRNIPGKPVFNFAIVGILLGGVLSLGMYIILDVIQFDLLPTDTSTTFAMLAPGQQGTFVIWTLGAALVVVALIIGTLLWVYRGAIKRIPWRNVAVLIAFALVVCFALVVFEEISHTSPASADPVAPAIPGETAEETAVISTFRWTPMIGVWLVAIGVIAFAVINRRRGGTDEEDLLLDEETGETTKRKRGRGFFEMMDAFPEFDLIVVIGTLILPWATAFVPYFMHGTTTDYIAFAESLPTVVYNVIFAISEIGTPDQVGQFLINAMALIPLVAISVTVGLLWNWRRWLVAAAIFHAIWAFFFTTVFTNIPGLFTGMIQSLGYWLEQQGERRGSQPQYYYLLIVMPFYEFLPVIGAALAMIAGMIVYWRRRLGIDARRSEIKQLTMQAQSLAVDEATDDAEVERVERRLFGLQQQLDESTRLTEMPFLLFWSWLGVLNLVGYSLAGEKMPWLGLHLTLPLIILTAWFLGRIVSRIDWQIFRQRGWMILLILPILLITLIQVVGPLLVGRGPFQGLAQVQLSQTYSWLASLAISGGVLYGVYRATRSVSWQHVRQLATVSVFVLLSVATFRSAWIASFVNYDYANEFLVYAHAAPSVKRVLNDITELSLRTTDGMALKFAYDNSVSWPYSWYFRDFTNAVFVGENPTLQNLEDAAVVVVGDDKFGTVEPLLGDRYQRFKYIRMWWPMQEYFYLTPDRLINLFDFSASNGVAAQLREGIFDIWWQRDYSTYGQAIGKDFSTTNWPVSDAMYVYVRKDFASQIWEYGVGDGAVENPLDEIEQNVCNSNWQPLFAMQSFENPEGMSRPVGVSLDEDGNLYVADEYAHHIVVFNSDGQVIDTIGQPVGGLVEGEPYFTRPNMVRVGPDGLLYVADTWDYGVDI